MQSPVVGFVSATGRVEVRAILGVPGAALLGDALSIPLDVTRVYLAPGEQYALVERGPASGRQLFLPKSVKERRTSLPLAILPLNGTQAGALAPMVGISDPDIVSFSPGGGSAVLYSKREGLLQVVTGLPTAPQIAQELKRSALPDDVAFLAIADDGATLLEGTAHSSVYLISAGNQPALVYGATDLGGMIFGPASTDALVFDRSGGSLILLHDVSGSTVSRPLIQGLPNLGDYPILQFDATNALITGPASSTLWQIDVNTLRSQQVQLPAAPATLASLRSPHRFALSWPSGQAAWILDTSGATGAVYFVPSSKVQAQ